MAEEYVNKERLIKHIERSFGEISTPFVVREIRGFPAADVVPKSEVERLQAEVDRLLELVGTIPPDRVEFVSRTEINAIKENLAREIFAEIEKLSYRFMNDKHYIFGDMVWDIAELKKKYTEG